MNRKLALAVASACMMAPAPLYALGLGTITLHSHLDQKLNADIRLYSDHPTELEGALVSLASPAAFARAGIDRPLILSDLHFKLLPKVDGHPVIRVTSDQPVREPFLNFIVEVDWRNGRILRQYTVLLNPPTMTALTPAGVRPAAAPAASVSPAATAMPLTSARTPVSAAAPPARRRAIERGTGGRATASVPVTAPGTVRTARNDTLWAIAQRVRPRQVTVEQMMLALLDANPQAFYSHNINRLKAGYVLRVPDISQVLGIDAKGALAQVRRQNLLWERYRQRLAARSTAGAAPGAKAAKTAASPAHGAPTAAQMEEQRLRLLAPSAGTASGSGAPGGSATASTKALRNQLALANETAASKSEEAKNLQGRVTALQGQVSKLKELLSLKDQQLADLQSRLKGPTPTAAPAAAPAAAKPAAPAAPKPAASAAKPATPAAKPAAPPAAPHVVTPPARTVAPVEQAGTLSGLFNNRGILALLAGGVVALLALVWLVLRRRRSGDAGFPLEMEGEALTPEGASSDFAPEAEAMAAEPADEEAPEAPETALAEAGGDVLAEAEIYMAYGRHEQAAEQLAQAVRSEPDRADLKVKLLEAYHALGDRAAFESTAEALYADLGDASHPLWQEVAPWGAELCPEHPLFRGEAEATADAEDSTVAAPVDEAADEPVDELLRNLVAAEPEAGDGHPAAAAPPAAEEPAEAEPEPVLDIGGFEEVGEAAPEAPEAPETEEEEIDFGFKVPEVGAETPEAEVAPLETHTPEEDMEETPAPSNVIEWEGGLASTGAGAAHGDEEPLSAGSEEDAALGEPDEIGTKLDLARAYLDMGDQEGARELLAEVLEEGNDPQREEAQGLMQQLSA